MQIFAICFTLLATITSLQNLPTDVNSRIAMRNIAVFSNAGFDFDHSLFSTDYVNLFLNNCSDKKTICFKTNRFKFSIPRLCESKPNVAKIGSMDVVGIITSNQHMDIDTKSLILANPEYPFIVYEYDLDQGIVGISYDIVGITGGLAYSDIRKSVKEGRYAIEREKLWSYSRRLTLDKFAACQK